MAVKDDSKKRKATPADSAAAKKQKKVEKKTVAVTDKQNGTTVVKATQKTKPVKSATTSAPAKTTVKTKVAAKAKKPAPPPRRAEDDDENDAEDDDDALSADRTAALLAGFESSSDDDSDDGETDGGATLDAAPAIPTDAIPTPPAPAAAALTARAPSTTADPPATLYVGRVPHGFYEPQMRAYFAQFGDVARLRLSRNRRTGASKHYAFVEFASGEVGRIVAATMHNYLLFGHVLKVRVLSADEVAGMPGLWRGEGARFKAVPWGGLERGRLRSADRKAWGRRVGKERKRRGAKAEKLKALGYEFESVPLRGTESVPRRVVEAGVGAGEDGGVQVPVEEKAAAKEEKVKSATGMEVAQETTAANGGVSVAKKTKKKARAA